jgi:ATP-binding cassette subfamily B (MDR/TAP) protein 1
MMIAVAPLIILSLALSSMAMISASKKEAKNYSIAGSLAEEIISGIKTVIAFNGQMFEYDRYNKVLRKAQKIGIKKAIITGFFSGLYMAVLFGSIGLAFWYGTQLVFSKEIQPGTVLTVFWSVFLGALKVGYALPNLGIISNAKLAAGEIFSIIDRESHMDEKKKKRKLENFEGKIEFRGVHFAYPSRYDHKILNGITFTVEPGQRIAFVGQSGCGKSTVFSLLSKFYHHSQGQIKIDETVIEEIDENWLRSMIGVVSQGPVLFTDTVIENLKMGKPSASIEEIIKACKMANAHEFIEKLPSSYDTVIGESGVQLSGGQKQRIAIARALIKNPKILLLDEATSALDTESEAAVQEALDHASEGRTTITIAHRLSTVKKADCIYVFEKGYIVEAGTHQELLEMKNHYWDLVKDQEIKGAEKHIPNDDVTENELMEVKRKKSENYNRKLSKAMSHVRGYWEVTNEDEEEDHEHENERPPQASIAAIFRFCKPELKYAFAGIFLSFLRGFQWPMFAILLGEFFKVLSMHDPVEAIHKSHLIAYIFLGVGIIGGISTFGSGWLLGTSGEKMAARLRLAVFKNILRQDGYYFDKQNHSVGRLTARLASDANNVQAAIDQRLSEVLQGITSLCAGIIYAVWISPVVAPVCIISAVVLAVTQIIIINYLKKRGVKDCKSADNASKVSLKIN